MSKLIKNLFLVSAAVLAFSMPVRAELCTEEERILLAVPGQDVILYYAYDGEGNRIGRLPALGLGENARLIRQDTLYRVTDDSDISLIRAGDLETVAEYPAEQYSLVTLGGYYVTIDNTSGVLTMYDEEINPLGQITSDKVSREFEYTLGDLLELPDSFLIKIYGAKDNIWMLVGKNGEGAQELTDPNLLQYLDQEGMTVYTIGDYLAVVPYPYAAEKGLRGVVITEDGTVVMDGIESALSEELSTEDNIYLNYGYDILYSAAQAVVRDKDGAYEIYDPALTCLGSVTEKPRRNGDCAGGFVKGIPYPELDGCVCEGFVIDVDTQTRIPYGQKGDVYLVLKDGECITVPAAGTPRKISSAYYVAATDEGTEVYRIDDQSLIASYPRDPRNCVSLGSEGIFLDDDPASGHWQPLKGTIYDNEGNPTYHSESGPLYAFTDGKWACHRGIYRGLVDMDGNWVLKDNLEWRE